MTTEFPATPPLVFSQAGDVTYGVICLICCLVGTLGNTISYLYFRSKKRDISNVIYKLITVNDALISVAVVPAGLTYFQHRSSGFFFGNSVSCTAWLYTWVLTIRLSIFLVICLCSTRTHSLLRPFSRQRTWPVLLVIAIYLVLQVVQLVAFNLLQSTDIKFVPNTARCEMIIRKTGNETLLMVLEGCMIITYIMPAFAVAISCVLSVVAIVGTKKDEERHVQRTLRQSRHRATLTILMFALLYGICNIPLVTRLILQTYNLHTSEKHDFYKFDTSLYFYNVSTTLLLALNSAVNPLLYMWRMPHLRGYVRSEVRWLFCGDPRRRASSTTVYNQRHMYSLEIEANLVVRNRLSTATTDV